MADEPLDLLHCGDTRRIASYLVHTDDGLALFDCGPSSCLPALHDALGARGLELHDVKHVLLSHIHLDHAGAAGSLVREHPALTVHVSEIGAPHLVDPSRLEASARRLYGDAAGVRIAPGRFVFAPTPPPEIDLDAWERTIDEIERRSPRRLALVHFGVFDDVERHLGALRATLRSWADRVGHGMDEPTFVAAARADVAASDPDDADAYDRAAPYWHCYLGLERYWRKRLEAIGTGADA
jgi:glyoxylase-like metal-dependent hydrolase (beta-lactamase superfamily II)